MLLTELKECASMLHIVYLCPGTEEFVNTYGCLITLLAAAEHLNVAVTELQKLRKSLGRTT